MGSIKHTVTSTEYVPVTPPETIKSSGKYQTLFSSTEQAPTMIDQHKEKIESIKKEIPKLKEYQLAKGKEADEFAKLATEAYDNYEKLVAMEAPEAAINSAKENYLYFQRQMYDCIGEHNTALLKRRDLEGEILTLEGEIALLKDFLNHSTYDTNPTWVPYSPKLESDNPNNIARFFIQNAFKSTLKAYLETVLEYKKDLFYSVWNGEDFNGLPLYIQSVNYSIADRADLLPLLDDYFSLVFYGREPMILDVSAVALDTPETQALAVLTMLYMDFFRVSHVSRVKVPLGLAYPGNTFTGAFLDMTTSKNSESSSLLNVNFKFLVLETHMSSFENLLEVPNSYSVTW